ncbi:hypothetical protein SteCoe_11098 [Stentor coeruleus]|uniref:U1-C C2H2-type zinc finger domain-containing protein n=1 Tax=Stentor coeruleus TaxID=5963 RepID=A0A1R2CE19_9CILI|nr:hypothetical protein SteCoe_11098 [Stentor coeruleus]
MPKYYCDYCDKWIQETRKQHILTEIHKKSKENYYEQFDNKPASGVTEWEYTKSHEEKILEKYLQEKMWKNIYKHFQVGNQDKKQS